MPQVTSDLSKYNVLSILTALIVLTYSSLTHAQFDNRQLLTVAKEGLGTITSLPSGIFCGTGCEIDSELFDFGELVEVRARPFPGWRFERWSGFCSGDEGCELIMISDRTVVAVFVPIDGDPPDDPPPPDPPVTAASISSYLPAILLQLLGQ